MKSSLSIKFGLRILAFALILFQASESYAIDCGPMPKGSYQATCFSCDFMLIAGQKNCPLTCACETGGRDRNGLPERKGSSIQHYKCKSDIYNKNGMLWCDVKAP